MQKVREWFEALLLQLQEWFQSPAFYSQLGLIAAAIFLATIVTKLLKAKIPLLQAAEENEKTSRLRNICLQVKPLLFSLFLIVFLGGANEVGVSMLDSNWLVLFAQGLAVVYCLYQFILRFIKLPFFRALGKWLLIPIALLRVVGLLDEVISYLDGLSIDLGNIHLSVYFAARVAVFGSILFWLGRVSNASGQQIIRNQEHLDVGTREIFAKLFQAVLFAVLFFLLLQILGINLTALAVFGGAIGIGLGFGLQSIASNFISGMIILLDRSLTVGDFVELDDGRTGVISSLNMRSTTLETYDGKDIVVPNETFISTSFVNWTHKDTRQRYELGFSVAYKTDLHQLFDLLREGVGSHPQVMSGDNIDAEYRPDAEIESFGDSGVNILVEFWMDGIDDGKNRVRADLLLMIWDLLHEHNIEMPFPQREVKILNPEK